MDNLDNAAEIYVVEDGHDMGITEVHGAEGMVWKRPGAYFYLILEEGE